MTYGDSKTSALLQAVRDFTEFYPDERAGIIVTYEKSLLVNFWLVFLYWNGDSPPGYVFENFTNAGATLTTTATRTYSDLVCLTDRIGSDMFRFNFSLTRLHILAHQQ